VHVLYSRNFFSLFCPAGLFPLLGTRFERPREALPACSNSEEQAISSFRRWPHIWLRVARLAVRLLALLAAQFSSAPAGARG
jgi:hypothetical protein